MAYTIDIPKPTDIIAVSQPDLRGNTNEVSTIFGVDHEDFNTVGAGSHKKVTFKAGNDWVPGANNIVMYNKLSADTGLYELFYRRTGEAPIPLTETRVYDQFTDAADHINWFRLPCGFLVKYGTTTTNPLLVTILLEPIGLGFPHYNQQPYCYVSAGGSAGVPAATGKVQAFSVTNLQFRVKSDTNNLRFTWFTIGI